MTRVTIADCRLIELPKIGDPRGNLTFLENDSQIPFSIERVFYLYDVPGGAMRAGHALRSCDQFIVAMAGSFDVIVDDGKEKRTFQLNRSYIGLYVPPCIWRELENFSSGSVCLVLASEKYSEEGYYREYESFLQATRQPVS